MTSPTQEKGKKYCKCKTPMKIFDVGHIQYWCGECEKWIKETNPPTQEKTMECKCAENTIEKLFRECPIHPPKSNEKNEPIEKMQLEDLYGKTEIDVLKDVIRKQWEIIDRVNELYDNRK